MVRELQKTPEANSTVMDGDASHGTGTLEHASQSRKISMRDEMHVGQLNFPMLPSMHVTERAVRVPKVDRPLSNPNVIFLGQCSVAEIYFSDPSFRRKASNLIVDVRQQHLDGRSSG